MNTFDGCCGSCIYLNTNDYVNHKDHCYCTYRKQYYNLTEKKCSYYRYDPNKDYYDLNRRWHIVSAVIAILPKAMSIPGMATLQNFRIDVLEKDKAFSQALCIYDVIGPFLARELTIDEKSQDICSMLLENWLIDVAKLVSEKQYIEAFEKYCNMVNALSEYYKEQLSTYLKMKLLPQFNLKLSL